MAIKLGDHASTIKTTCQNDCDKFDIKFPQITTLQRENAKYKKRVASLEADVHSLKMCHNTLSSLILQQTPAQASTNARVEVIYNKLNQANYNASSSTSTPPNPILVIDENLRVYITNLPRQQDSMGSVVDTLQDSMNQVKTYL